MAARRVGSGCCYPRRLAIGLLGSERRKVEAKRKGHHGRRSFAGEQRDFTHVYLKISPYMLAEDWITLFTTASSCAGASSSSRSSPTILTPSSSLVALAKAGLANPSARKSAPQRRMSRCAAGPIIFTMRGMMADYWCASARTWRRACSSCAIWVVTSSPMMNGRAGRYWSGRIKVFYKGWHWLGACIAGEHQTVGQDMLGRRSWR